MSAQEFGSFLQLTEKGLAWLLARKDHFPWYADWKLWLGLVGWLFTWAHWVLVGYKSEYHLKCMHTAGINFVMLHAVQYYGCSGLWVSMVMLVLQGALTTYIWWKGRDIFTTRTFDATSIYQDLSLPFLQPCMLFFGQTLLAFFYLLSVFRKVQTESISYVFWTGAYFCLQMSAFFNRGEASLLGTTWKTDEWVSIIQNSYVLQYEIKTYAGKTDIFRPHRIDLVLRGIFGFLVNNVFRDILAFTIPVLLAHFKDPLNFVVYCVGVNFIVVLDDMTTKRFRARPLEGSVQSQPEVTAELSLGFAQSTSTKFGAVPTDFVDTEGNMTIRWSAKTDMRHRNRN